MYNFFLTLTIATIISQLAHNYSVFIKFSFLEGWMKISQAVIFCGIISVSIFAFVLVGNIRLALLGAIIEIIINILYYGQDFWRNGFPVRKNKTGSILAYWRQNWGRFVFGVLIPILIYIFAEQMVNLKS